MQKTCRNKQHSTKKYAKQICRNMLKYVILGTIQTCANKIWKSMQNYTRYEDSVI